MISHQGFYEWKTHSEKDRVRYTFTIFYELWASYGVELLGGGFK